MLSRSLLNQTRLPNVFSRKCNLSTGISRNQSYVAKLKQLNKLENEEVKEAHRNVRRANIYIGAISIAVLTAMYKFRFYGNS